MMVSNSLSVAGENRVADKQKADPAIYPELRNQALNGSRQDFGLPPTNNLNEAWGVVMDIVFDDGGSYTVVSIIDGSASIYLSSGGGYIGGGAHTSIREAAITMVAMATQFQSRMAAASKFPLPKRGDTAFYILTDNGILTASALEDDLGEERHYLSPLFYAGQEVVTQYRLIEE